MTTLLQRGARRPSRLSADLGSHELVNGFVGFLFSCTGPVAVILTAGASSHLPVPVVASWVTAVFCLNGLLTIAASLTSRQPLVFFWTIPGTVVVAQAMAAGTTWPEVVGAFVMTGVLLAVLPLTGVVDRVMHLLPMPIVMAMVAGVFLGFGTDLVRSVDSDPGVAGVMVVVFVVVGAVPALARWVPPVLAALIVGAVAVTLGGHGAIEAHGRWIAQPVWTTPTISAATIVDLVIPLAVTVLVVQNGQGMAVLRAAGHQPRMDRITTACGLVSLVAAPFGGASTCLAGPTNALVTAHGERTRQYAAAVWCGALAIGFGLLAPGMVRVITSMPSTYVAALGGLAMLKALQGAFRGAFSGTHAEGALITFLVTVSGITVLGIGAAFWGLCAGVAATVLLDRDGAPSPMKESRS